jgi:hypothetical protein
MLFCVSIFSKIGAECLAARIFVKDAETGA